MGGLRARPPSRSWFLGLVLATVGRGDPAQTRRITPAITHKLTRGIPLVSSLYVMIADETRGTLICPFSCEIPLSSIPTSFPTVGAPGVPYLAA